jgi:hypothetical protein
MTPVSKYLVPWCWIRTTRSPVLPNGPSCGGSMNNESMLPTGVPPPLPYTKTSFEALGAVWDKRIPMRGYASSAEV